MGTNNPAARGNGGGLSPPIRIASGLPTPGDDGLKPVVILVGRGDHGYFVSLGDRRPPTPHWNARKRKWESHPTFWPID